MDTSVLICIRLWKSQWTVATSMEVPLHALFCPKCPLRFKNAVEHKHLHVEEGGESFPSTWETYIIEKLHWSSAAFASSTQERNAALALKRLSVDSNCSCTRHMDASCSAGLLDDPSAQRLRLVGINNAQLHSLISSAQCVCDLHPHYLTQFSPCCSVFSAFLRCPQNFVLLISKGATFPECSWISLVGPNISGKNACFGMSKNFWPPPQIGPFFSMFELPLSQTNFPSVHVTPYKMTFLITIGKCDLCREETGETRCRCCGARDVLICLQCGLEWQSQGSCNVNSGVAA